VPQILHLTENLIHMKLNLIHIENYLLGSYYCRKHILKGSVHILTIKFSTLNLDIYCVDQDIELCAAQLFRNLHLKYITTL